MVRAQAQNGTTTLNRERQFSENLLNGDFSKEFRDGHLEAARILCKFSRDRIGPIYPPMSPPGPARAFCGLEPDGSRVSFTGLKYLRLRGELEAAHETRSLPEMPTEFQTAGNIRCLTFRRRNSRTWFTPLPRPGRGGIRPVVQLGRGQIERRACPGGLTIRAGGDANLAPLGKHPPAPKPAGDGEVLGSQWKHRRRQTCPRRF